MLEIKPKGMFSADYGVFKEGEIIAVVQKKAFSLREKGVVEFKNRRYFVYREGVLSGDFIMETEEGSLAAKAEKPSFMRDSFIVRFDRRELTMRGRILSLIEKNDIYEQGVLIGEVSSRGFFSRDMFIDIHVDIPTEIQLFIVWLALIIKERNSSTPNAGAV